MNFDFFNISNMELKCYSNMRIFADKLRNPFEKIIQLSSGRNVEIKLCLCIAYLDIEIFAIGLKYTFRLTLDLKPEYESRVEKELRNIRKLEEMASFICTINSKDLQHLSEYFDRIQSLAIEATATFFPNHNCYTEKSLQNIFEAIDVLTQNYKINTVIIEHILYLLLQTRIKCNKIYIRKNFIEQDEDLYSGIDLALLYFEKTDDIYLRFNLLSVKDYEKNAKLLLHIWKISRIKCHSQQDHITLLI